MSCNCPKCSYNVSPAEFAKMTNNQPKILVYDLINPYCELTWKLQDIKIPVKDTATTAISNQAYIFLLEPGTVVKFDNHRYFYSCPSAMMNLEGMWTDEESTSYSTYEFLREVLNDGGCVELVLEG